MEHGLTPKTDVASGDTINNGKQEASSNYVTCSQLYSIASVEKYKKIRVGMIQDFGEVVRTKVKTYYSIKKDRPMLDHGIIEPSRALYGRIFYEPFVNKSLQEMMVFNRIKYEKGEKVIVGHDTAYFAGIGGGYGAHLTMLSEKLDVMLGGDGREDDLIAINSFDGAVHGLSEKKQLNVTSYNTALLSKTALIKGLTPANTSLILTWKQVIGDEKVVNVFPAVKDLYKELGIGITRNSLNGRKLSVYEVHDCKMIYSLTQHSAWNRKYNPFLLCDCHRGDGVVDPNHVCIMLTDTETKALFEKSHDNFVKHSSSIADYNKDKHCAYADKHVKGVTHYGFDPNELLRSSIRFDMFHLRAAQTRKLLDYLRKFLGKHNITIQENFNGLLKIIWNSDFLVMWWAYDRPLTKLKGKELLQFINAIPRVQIFLKKYIPNDIHAERIDKVLQLWAEIVPFLNVTQVHDKESYNADIITFENNVKEFYRLGAYSLLSLDYVGDLENVYSHILRFYLPIFARDAFEKHSMGLGIFTMQGFEHRNKESKHVFLNYTNKKGNTVIQTMNRLQEYFKSNA